jgi:hypothetical protein
LLLTTRGDYKFKVSLDFDGQALTLKQVFVELIKQEQSLDLARKELTNIVFRLLNSDVDQILREEFGTNSKDENAEIITNQFLKAIGLERSDRKLQKRLR